MTETVFGIAILVGIVALLFAARRRDKKRLPGREFVVAVAVAVTAEIVGTVVRISGVLLAIPVALAMVVAVRRSTWRLGDLAAITLLLALGMGAATVVDFAAHPDSGSQADQAALALALLGVCLSISAFVVRALRRQ